MKKEFNNLGQGIQKVTDLILFVKSMAQKSEACAIIPLVSIIVGLELD